ncbi:cystathionine beta-lyase, partial [Lichenibacterium minor]
GVTSLVMAYDSLPRGGVDVGPRLVRLNIGLEQEDALIADLASALDDAQR